jgi:hypothetical protein
LFSENPNTLDGDESGELFGKNMKGIYNYNFLLALSDMRSIVKWSVFADSASQILRSC